MQTIKHSIAPVFNGKSEILILGTFPSVKSRQAEFFYANPQNRFWSVLSAVIGCDMPVTTEKRKNFLLNNNIALWDVVSVCDISGSSDSSIKNVSANDIGLITSAADIKQIFTNGKTAKRLFDEYVRDKIGREAVCLPSTSPANAAYSLEKLTEAWSVIQLKKTN